MSRRLLRLGVRLHPDKAAFRVHDRGADPADLQAPTPPVGGALVSIGYDQMWIGSLQDDVEVTVLLEEWDGEPPPGRGTWEQEASGEMYLRGAVAVSTATGEPVLHGVRLLGGVGRYQMRIRAQHREAIARLYDALLDRFRDGFSLQFQAALWELQGVEHYLIQLWPSPTASGAHRMVSDAALALSGAFPPPPSPNLEPPDQTGPLPLPPSLRPAAAHPAPFSAGPSAVPQEGAPRGCAPHEHTVPLQMSADVPDETGPGGAGHDTAGSGRGLEAGEEESGGAFVDRNDPAPGPLGAATQAQAGREDEDGR